jgi:hypothetical protein
VPRARPRLTCRCMPAPAPSHARPRTHVSPRSTVRRARVYKSSTASAVPPRMPTPPPNRSSPEFVEQYRPQPPPENGHRGQTLPQPPPLDLVPRPTSLEPSGTSQSKKPSATSPKTPVHPHRSFFPTGARSQG